MEEERKKIFSALQPTGKLTIGNYIGALKNMAALQDEYDCFYAVANLHSVTADILPATLRSNSLDALALLLASGIDPNKSTLFMQSHVHQHSELAWVLGCYTMMGEASRMTQFKDKSQKRESVNVGLFYYPVLMAADILLYQADFVPIGKDQKQHLELCRTIAERFNGRFSPTFVVPDGIFPKHGAKINSLTDPNVKMSKSDENENSAIYLLDSEDVIMRKFKRAVTDSGSEIRFGKDKAGISNLITIYSAFSGEGIKEVENSFANSSYVDFKIAVGETVAAKLKLIQAEYKRLIADKEYLANVMKDGAQKAAYVAQKTLSKVYRKIGMVI